MKIELRHCTKTLGDRKILDHVSLVFESGKIYSIAGEEQDVIMLLKIIAHLTECTEGSAEIDGSRDPDELFCLKKMGMLLDKPPFEDQKTAFQNLCRLASLRGSFAEDDIVEILEDFKLEKDETRYEEYSEEQKQLCRVAQALSGEPGAILLRNPFLGLSQESRERVGNRLRKARDRGAIVILALAGTEISEEIRLMSDGTIIMEKGRAADTKIEESGYRQRGKKKGGTAEV